jgi:GT2 family glycosyltransferase
MLWPSNELFTEFERSAVPGDGGPPIQADFGPFGIQVCLEMHWPGPWRRLKSNDVKLILFPSEQSGGMLLRHRAWQTRAFVVSAVSKGGPSQVIDPVGNIVAEWRPETPLPMTDVGLAFELVHFDQNERKVRQLAAEYRDKIRIVTYKHERLWRITSSDPGLNLVRVLEEREILTLDEYLRRVGIANDLVRYRSHASSKLVGAATPLAGASVRSVSIIIPCLRVQPTLLNCLHSLQAQRSACKVEIILVLNGPDAASVEFDWPGIKIVRESKKGPAAARNAGARLAIGDILAFIDSDCVANVNWLESAVATVVTCRSRCIVAGAIRRPHHCGNWASMFDSVTFLRQECYVRRFQLFVTANVIMPRGIFERVGFFDECFAEAACEDWEWALRARRRGVLVVYDANAVVEHPCMETMSQLRAKVERLARGEAVLRSRTRRPLERLGLIQTIWKQFVRVADDRMLGAADRLRVMWVGVAVAYWSWRAERRPDKGTNLKRDITSLMKASHPRSNQNQPD